MGYFSQIKTRPISTWKGSNRPFYSPKGDQLYPKMAQRSISNLKRNLPHGQLQVLVELPKRIRLQAESQVFR